MRTKRTSLYIIIALFAFFIALMVVTTLFSNYYLKSYTEIIQHNLERRLSSECKFITSIVPIELLEEFVVPEDMKKPIYQQKIKELEAYAEKNNLMFAFFVRLVDGKVQYIIDSDPNPKTHCGLDTLEEPYELATKAFEGEPAYSKIGEYLEGWEGVLSAYMPIFDEDGKVVAAVGVDISDKEIVARKNTEEYFRYVYIVEVIILILLSSGVILLYRKKAEQHSEASVMKSQFLSKMSHEIRTPMNAIIGFSRMAKNAKNKKERNEYIERIDHSSEYLLHLINSILDIAKIEAGKMLLEEEKASIIKIVEHVHEILMPQAIDKNQSFTIQIEENVPNYVYCDKEHLAQILINLASNAIKFTPNGGEISIVVSLIEKLEYTCNIQFVVKDNGVGIDEKFQKKLFEPFEQGDGGITRKYGGTGLGLTLSKLFIEMMKGKISVTSKINNGTTFTFDIWLDLIPEGKEPREIEEIQEEEDTGEPIDCDGKTFLVVEDNEINQIIAQNVLDDFGATIDFANDGKEGVEKFKTDPNKYDLIFMDVQMPVMNGIEATKQIRASGIENAKTIPIIAMTAETYKEDIEKVLNAGMNAHLGKPLRVNEVAAAIRRNLKKTE